MFTLIRDFFSWAHEAFQTIGEFLTHLLSSIFTVFEVIGKAFAFIYNLVTGGYFPEIFVGFFLITALIFIVYMIINRDPGD